VHVVELVVSNGFDPTNASTVAVNRGPKAGFETQYRRWVFLTTKDVPCPP
jgi:hypothetical protein